MRHYQLTMRSGKTLLVWVFLGCFLSTITAQTSATYDVLLRDGRLKLQAGQADQALSSAQHAIKLRPERWEAYALAGGALMDLKRYEDAADSLSKAIDKAPATKQSGLRDLRKQCAVVGTAAAPSIAGTSQPSGAPAATRAEDKVPIPSMEDTMTFIREHIVSGLTVYAHQKTLQDSEGYFGGDWTLQEGFTIEGLTYDSQTKSMVLQGKAWEQFEGGKPEKPEPSAFEVKIPLPTVKVDAIRLERNPYYDECKQSSQIRDREYPFSYSASPEWLLTFSNGQENNYAGLTEIGLPVESQATGLRVQKALMHALDLAGDRKAEPF